MAAREIWDDLSPDMIRAGVITPWDVPMFGELLEAMVLAKFYRAAMANQLTGTPVPNGQTPAVYQYRALMTVITAGVNQFGMTPASRSRIIALIAGADAASGARGAARPNDVLSS